MLEPLAAWPGAVPALAPWSGGQASNQRRKRPPSHRRNHMPNRDVERRGDSAESRSSVRQFDIRAKRRQTKNRWDNLQKNKNAPESPMGLHSRTPPEKKSIRPVKGKNQSENTRMPRKKPVKLIRSGVEAIAINFFAQALLRNCDQRKRGGKKTEFCSKKRKLMDWLHRPESSPSCGVRVVLDHDRLRRFAPALGLGSGFNRNPARKSPERGPNKAALMTVATWLHRRQQVPAPWDVRKQMVVPRSVMRDPEAPSGPAASYHTHRKVH